jgi:hypothetical protein
MAGKSSRSRKGRPNARKTDIIAQTGIYTGNSRVLVILGATFRRDRIGHLLIFWCPRNDAAGVVRRDAIDTGATTDEQPNADYQEGKLKPHHVYNLRANQTSRFQRLAFSLLEQVFPAAKQEATIFRDFSEIRARRRLFGLADHDPRRLNFIGFCVLSPLLALRDFAARGASCFRGANGSNLSATDRSEGEEAPPALGSREWGGTSPTCAEVRASRG